MVPRSHLFEHIPSKFHFNPIVKAYIISESFLWSGWNLVIPIAALFVTSTIPGGDIQVAATAYSVYLIFRVIFEILSGKLLANSSDRKKLSASIVGVICTSIAMFSLALVQNPFMLFVSYAIGGMGLGIGTPAKNALFSIHLDKNKESTEWGLADGIAFICMALATAVGGFIAANYGFQILFVIAGTVTVIGALPYVHRLISR